jgi:hypothetical protein
MGLRKHVGARLTSAQEEFLRAADMLGTTLRETFGGDIELARAAWLLHSERLIAECKPGQRPWGFWAFSTIDWKDDPERPPQVADLSEGSFFLAVPSREWEVLERQGLLSEAELEWLRNWLAITTSPQPVRDPADKVVPGAKVLYFPHLDTPNGNHT